jgi:hypothetical protein
MSYRDDYREVEREGWWTIPRVIVALVVLAVAGLVIRLAVLPIWFANRTISVVQQQIDPAELLRKYELFKDESAQLDAKLASIKIKQKQIDEIKALPSKDRTDREELMIWEQEIGGMKYSFNQLAADYNAGMSKINFRFCNVGDLPQGASTPLPREYKPYEEE